MENFSWNLSMSLNVDAMNQGAAFLIGKKDFTSFSKLHTDVKTNICQVSKAIWTPYTDMLVFQITADRFLRNMVRAIVGTLIEVGKGNLSPQEISIILDSLDRSAAGMSVPANGLFLTQVEYPQEIFTSSPKSPFLKWI